MNKESSQVFKGNIFLFYSYDVGDDIELTEVREKNLVKERLFALSPFFKHYNIPLSFDLQLEDDQAGECVISKAYRFGVLSFCFKISFEESFENLKLKLIDIHEVYRKKADDFAKKTFDKVLPAIEHPNFYHLKNSYYVVNVMPSTEEKVRPEAFREKYGDTIASLLRLETTRLSEFQKREILSATTGYSGEDFLIIDSEASFIYDVEYQELLEFFELATIKQLQLQYFDMLLDQRLERFYLRPYKIPLKAYIPLISGRLDQPEQQLARLRVDISVITERLESSVNLAGDAYFSHVFAILEKKLSLAEWRRSIDSKLDIIRDLYTVYQHRLETIHAEMLEVIIVILISIEIIFSR
ncbi:hypothetical protein KAW80_01915 [Candidatus Babeliales bacterium]|nr:hypothetical protein [Candidatus Babeliales bacterium]